MLVIVGMGRVRWRTDVRYVSDFQCPDHCRVDVRFRAQVFVQMISQIFDRVGPWYDVAINDDFWGNVGVAVVE